MTLEEKQHIFDKCLNKYRTWSYDRLAHQIEVCNETGNCLEHIEGTMKDGTYYQIEINVFYANHSDQSIVVMGDLCTLPEIPIEILKNWNPKIPIHNIEGASGGFFISSDGTIEN